MATAALLAGLAVVLAGPVASRLARSDWPAASPRAAIVLWQALGLAAGLSLLGAALAAATWGAPGSPPAALSSLVGHLLHAGPGTLDARQAAGLAASLAVAGGLTGALLATATSTIRRRARHRRLLDLVGRPTRDLSGAVVIDHQSAVAYCLPGLRPRVVLSAGALEVLGPEELAAVLGHERAHIHDRHDLVVLPFLALLGLWGWVPGVRRAGPAVAELVELVADDRARRAVPPTARAATGVALARALVELAAGGAPACSLAAADTSVGRRVERLLIPPPEARLAAILAVAAAGVLVALPPALLLLLPRVA